MSEHKDYISRADELGNIHIAEEVLAAVAAAAAMEVKGVSALAAGTDFAELLGKKNQAKGVRIHVEENVKSTMESVTGLEITAVNVSVAGVVFPPKQA